MLVTFATRPSPTFPFWATGTANASARAGIANAGLQLHGAEVVECIVVMANRSTSLT
jgi:hypothetical protein